MQSPVALADALLGLSGWLVDFARLNSRNVQVPELLRALEITTRLGGGAAVFAAVVEILNRAALEVLRANELEWEGTRYAPAAEAARSLRRAMHQATAEAAATCIEDAIASLRYDFPGSCHQVINLLQLVRDDVSAARALIRARAQHE